MEKFMQPFQSLDLEVESEIFINTYDEKLRGFTPMPDSWFLNYNFKMVPVDTRSAFLGSIFMKVCLMNLIL